MSVGSKKNFFDAIDFDEIGDAMDLWFNRLNNSFEFDAISDEDEFNAVVISPPVPIGANSKEMSTFLDGVAGSFTDTLPKFIFRGRLKDVDSHHVFWPDPCDPRFVEDAGGQEAAIDWVSKHMKVMAIGATEVPKVGDTVRVKLDKEGIYTTSPETAIMIGLVTSIDSITTSTALANIDSAECRGSLSKAFDGYTPPAPPDAPGSGSEMPFKIDPSPVNPYDILLFGDSQMQGAIGRVLQGRFQGIRLSKVGSQAIFWINNRPLDTELRKNPRLIIIQLNSNGISGTDDLINKIKYTNPSSQIRWYGAPPANLAPTSWSKDVQTREALASFNKKRERYNKTVEAKLRTSGLNYTFINPFRDIPALKNWPVGRSDGIHIPDAVAKTFYESI
jgi:hypothetical protein